MAITYETIAPFCEERFIRSAGPGGQNVNKVATSVQLRFDLKSCDTLTASQKARIEKKLESRLTQQGELLLRASEHRTQERNRQAARIRLVNLLNEAEKQQAYRVPTRPSLAAKRKRVENKTRRSSLKKLRGRVQPKD